jgi:hypothetical protein
MRKEKHAAEAAKFAGVDTSVVKAQWLLAKDAYEQATKKWRAVRENLAELKERKRVRQEAFRKNRRSAARVSAGSWGVGGGRVLRGWEWGRRASVPRSHCRASAYTASPAGGGAQVQDAHRCVVRPPGSSAGCRAARGPRRATPHVSHSTLPPAPPPCRAQPPRTTRAR